MASPAPFNQKTYDDLSQRAADLEQSLGSSNTAYAPGTAPTSSDLYDQATLEGVKNKIKVLEGQKLAEQWYGTGRNETTFNGEGTGENVFMKGLNMLSTPLYGIAGAAEWATGTGSKKDLFANINENIKQREGFGNILSRTGLPYGASMPLGFALDVALDPVNWATAGTAALVPRVTQGLVKGAAREGATGALKGVSSAITSRMLPLGMKTANVATLGTIGRALRATEPIAGEVAPNVGKIQGSIANFARKMAGTTARATEKYDSVIGRDMVEATQGGGKYGRDLIARDGAPGWNYRGSDTASLGEVTEELLNKSKIGQSIVQAFKYSPSDWLKKKMLQDKIVNMAPEFKKKYGIDFFPQSSSLKKQFAEGAEVKLGEASPTARDPFLDSPQQNLFETASQNEELPIATRRAAELMAPGVDAANATDRTVITATTKDEWMKEMLQEAQIDADLADIVKIREGLLDDKTGIKAFDDLSKYFRSITVAKEPGGWKLKMPKKVDGEFRAPTVEEGQKAIKPIKEFLDAYSGYITAFKVSKIGLSLSAWTNALLGNLVMAEMSGINVANPQLLKAMKEAAKLAMSGEKNQPLVIQRIFANNPLMKEWAHKYPLTFSSIMGFNLDSVLKTADDFSKAADNAIKEGMSLGWSREELSKEIASMVKGGGVDRAMIEGGVTPISYAAVEMGGPNENWMRRLQTRAAEAAARPNADMWTKTKNLALNKAMEAYGSTDQVWRMGTIIHLMENGVSEAEMRKLGRLFGMSASDIADVHMNPNTGEKMFKLMPEKAMQISSETFMNYMAMPAVVKVLRNLPVLGAPLVSFSYGMTTKAGKTALYNPAIYNKINYLMSEISGDKSPLEKESLKQPYYTWFNQPGMMKLPLPIFEQNPIYADLQSLIPYYSLNMFTPSERKYKSTLPDEVLSVLDKLPVLQDPVGQQIFDYFVQPLMLQKGEIPQNAFGSPLYPKDATGLQKAGYFTRQLGEAVTPGVMGFAGFPAGVMFDADKLDWMPNYKFRGAAHAVQGENPIGIPSKESAGSRSLRQFMSMFGVQLHPMNTAYTASEVNKQIKGK